MRNLILFTLSTLALLIHPLSLPAQNSFSISLDVNSAASDQDVTPDFDGDGMVGFSDFLAFAGLFGSRQGDGRYEAKYDLDSDGAIGFSDFLIFSASFGKEVSSPGGDATQVAIPDTNLRAVIADSLGKASDVPITQAEMASLTRLDAPNKNIRDLTGLEFAINLTELNLSDNSIADVSPLSNLTSLEILELFANSIEDVTPLRGLTKLERLGLFANSIEDVTPLRGLTRLEWLGLSDTSISDVTPLRELTRLEILGLSDNSIEDVTPLRGLTRLEWLGLSDNSIANIAPLSNLTNLQRLGLSDNSISDLAPLVANTGLGEGDEIDVSNNPLSATSINTHIPALQSRGVDVGFSVSKPTVNNKELRIPLRMIKPFGMKKWKVGDNLRKDRQN